MGEGEGRWRRVDERSKVFIKWAKSVYLGYRVSFGNVGRLFLVELEGRAYRCRCCDSPLALADNVLSRSFHCRYGRAYLFNSVVNVSVGPREERLMLSGMDTVADLFCCCCGQILGWKYLAAYNKDLKYKEGKFVLEEWKIVEEIADEFDLDPHPSSSDLSS